MTKVSPKARETRLVKESVVLEAKRSSEWSPAGRNPNVGRKPPSEQNRRERNARRKNERVCIWQSKRAHIYESAVSGGEPEEAVTVKAVKRSTSFINPLAFFRRPEAAKDNSRIYYIYANPLPVGLKEEEEETHSRTPEQTPLTPSLSMQEYARRPSSGLVLDPPMFYLQL
ncbi:uncharacterized protein si:dkey-246e1.3 isoform X1 [Oryzias melastigma]|uniref:uncharacterized protein si:dkey-246e1.3 isoform X1 n=1 Tax=Oryzias melastigma TaxID=30732 RepID=UPI00168D1C7A|nr:uncharacterized protein si:dkey-246e1.3 isoform X1 [Oryzias melastigma]